MIIGKRSRGLLWGFGGALSLAPSSNDGEPEQWAPHHQVLS